MTNQVNIDNKEVNIIKQAQNWADGLNVPYHFPNALEAMNVTGFKRFKQNLSYILSITPETQKPTGLENFPREEFVKAAYQHDAFYPTRQSRVLMTASWDRLLEPRALRNNGAKPFISAMRKELQGKNITELGAGTKGPIHGKTLTRIFRASSYTAVDIREVVVRGGGVQDDALQYLLKLPDKSTIVLAFGLFNEPLSPINGTSPFDFIFPAASPERASRRQWEQEYLRRLAMEISRVTPDGGIVFGDGLHPLSWNNNFDHYLQGSGFQHDGKLYAAIAKSRSIDARAPFFMRKRTR